MDVIDLGAILLHSRTPSGPSVSQTIHENAEVFDVKAEYTFNWLQVITACFSSFAHGANDVANAVGTLAACYGVWNLNAMPEGKTEVPIWILALGGVGISTGLATWGYKIIETLGVFSSRAAAEAAQQSPVDARKPD